MKKKSKSGYRRSVSGRRYKGLQPHVRKRLEAKIKARKEASKPHYEKRGRPKQVASFDKGSVKRANERLRALEKGTKLNKFSDTTLNAEDSNEYRLIKKLLTEEPNARGRIYKKVEWFDSEGRLKTGIRFINQTELKKLAEEEAREKGEDIPFTETDIFKYYNASLNKVLDAQTSTTRGMKDKFTKAYGTFMENYGTDTSSAFYGLTLEDYIDFFRIFRDRVSPDKNNHYDYDVLQQTLEWIDIGLALTDGQMGEIFSYIANDQWDKIERKYRKSNY